MASTSLRYSVYTSATTVALLLGANAAFAQTCATGGANLVLDATTQCLDNTGTVGAVTVNTGVVAKPSSWSNLSNGVVIGNEPTAGADATITSITINSGTTINVGAQNYLIGNGGTRTPVSTFKGRISSIQNDGTIANTGSFLLNSNGVIGSITNNGTIGSGLTNGFISFTGEIGTITNNGSMGTISNAAVGTITTLTNAANATIATLANGGVLTTLNNSGTITAFTNSATGTIATLNAFADTRVTNSGAITNLNNNGVQVTITNKLPTNYTALFNSPTAGQYSKLVVNTASGAMNFAINSSSTLALGRYDNVIFGVSGASILGAKSGVLNGTNWKLMADDGGVANVWDLVAGPDYAIDNRNLTTTEINNSQVLASGLVGGLANDGGSITRLINSGTINGGVDNGAGTIGTLTNSGVIDGNGGTGIAGVQNLFGGTINTLTNTATGTIRQTMTGVMNRGTIGNFANAGTISGSFAAIENHRGTINSLTNTGTLTGGVQNLGSIGTFTNSGAITGASAGVRNSGSIQTFNNATNVTYSGVLPVNYNVIINSNTIGGYGQLVAANATGVMNFAVDASSTVGLGTYLGVLSGVTNANLGASSFTGQVNGNSWSLKDVNADNVWDLVFGPDYTIDNRNLTTVEISNSQTVNSGNIAGLGNTNGSIVRLINNGTILGGVDNAAGQINSLQNSGTIDARANGQGNISGVDNTGGALTTLVNSVQGQILGSAFGVDNGSRNNAMGVIQTLDNAGRIEGALAGVNNNGGSIDDFTNSGTVAGGVRNSGGTILRLINSGTITSTSNGHGVDNNAGVMDILTNTATGSITGNNYGVMNSAPGSRITLLTNRGAITGGIAGVNNNQGRIITFDNATAVTYTGTLPEAYNIIINSNTAGGYGQLAATGPGVTGSLRFGIHGSSVVATGSYLGVLQGLTAANIDVSTMSGQLGTTVSWSLTDVNNDNSWDLVVTLLPYGNNNSNQTTGAINNAGTIQSGSFAGVGNLNGTIGSFSNSGTILGGVDNRQGEITRFLNNGRVNASGQDGENRAGMFNSGGVIGSLHNGAGGSISGADYGINNSNPAPTPFPFAAGPEPQAAPLVNAPVQSLISELTNLGAITGGIAGVNNVGGVIVTFNNATPVTFVGALPTNYNVIVNSNTAGGYGQLIATGDGVTGLTRFGVAAGSTLAVGSYAGVLQGVTAANIDAATRTGFYDRYRWTLVDENADNVWDLAVRRRGPDIANTIAALRRNASGINQVINQRSANLANALDYDCAVFDKNGVCVSIGGRYTGVGSKNDAGVLGVAAYRLTQQLRVGAFIDQTVNETKPTNIGVTSTTPTLGAFMVYEQNADMSGLRLRSVFAWQQSKLSPTREIFTETEGGRGSARLDAFAFAAEVSYGFPMSKDWVIAPYAGLRRSVVERQGYNERSVEGVEYPISYDTYGQYLTTAYGGLRLSGRLSQQVSALVGVGVEHDVTSKMNLYSGSSAIYEFETFALDAAPSRHRTRAVGSAALRYDLGENRAVSLAAALRQSPYGSNPAFTAALRYTAGF